MPQSRRKLLLSLVLLLAMIVGAGYGIRWIIGAHGIETELRKLRAAPITCECRCP